MNLIAWKIAIKNLRRNKTFSIINISGLSIGIATFCLIMHYVAYESSYDSFHVDKDKIYRVESQFRLNGEVTQNIATASFGYAPAMHREFPEIESFCRINGFNHEKDIQYKEMVEREEFVFMVDSNFFSFFSYPLILGNTHEVLAHPRQIVLSEKAAAKYFRNEDPIGKIMQVREFHSVQDYVVSGIFRNVPGNSNVKFDILLSYDYNNDFLNNFWYMHETYLYIKVPHTKDLIHIQAAFPKMAEKYKVMDGMKDQLWEVNLVPINDIHLNPPKPYELEYKGSKRSILFLFGMAMLILVIAWINFINLSTVTLLENSNNYSIMKSQGASKTNLFFQYLTEAFLINLIALFGSLIFLVFGVRFLGRGEPAFSLHDFWLSTFPWYLIVGAFLLGVVVTGVLPGITIPSLKNGIKSGQKQKCSGTPISIRAKLVVTQYVMAILFIVGTFTIYKQLNYMSSKEVGADIRDVLVFKTPTNTNDYFQKVDALRNKITGLAGVESISLSSVVPGQQVGYMGSHKRDDAQEGDDRLFEMMRIDPHFIPLYELKLIEGRNFSQNYEADKQSIVVNEKGVKWFGFQNNLNALGKTVHLEGYGNTPFTIVGILEDYHQQSVKLPVTPVVFILGDENYWIPMKYFSVRSSNSDKASLIKSCNNIFKHYFPNASFEYFFTDQFFNRQYEADHRFGTLILILSVLSILMVCIGILGLSGYMLTLRTKEIGIRKVNGAKIWQVMAMLNQDFVKWVAIAFVIASPIAYYAMNQWLKNFAYKTELNWWIFALAGVLALGIALLTVSFQSWKAANRNPVEALRYE